MTKVILRRKEDNAGVFRSIKVFVDGEVVAKLRPGKSFFLELAPGMYQMQGRMDWTTTNLVAVQIDEGQPAVEVTFWLPWDAIGKMFTSPASALGIEVAHRSAS